MNGSHLTKSLILLLSFIVASAHLLVADDEVHMINGKVFRGTVVEQTDSHVSIELPLGLITLKRGEIREVKISPDSEDKRQQLMTVKKFRDQIKELNKAARKAYEIRNSLNMTRQAFPSTQQSEIQKNRVYEMELELAQLNQEFESYRIYSGKRVVPAIYQTYKTLQSKISKIEADIVMETKILEGMIQKEALANQKVAEAKDRLQTAIDNIQTEYSRLKGEGCPHEELSLALKAIAELSDSSSGPIRIPLLQRGNTYMLPVQLNGAVTDIFMLDTGASGILINKRLFQKLHLPRDKFIGKSRSTIANGETMETETWLVDEVRVSAFTVKNVKVTVPLAADDDITPLLGGGFLNHFHFRIDPVGKTLTLEPQTGRNQ